MDLGEPRRTSAMTAILEAIATLRGYLVPLAIVLLVRAGDLIETIVTAALATGFIVVVALLRWWRVRWWVEENRFRIRSGVLRLEDRTIPVDRIQRIDRNQTLLSRLLGLYELRAETAGSAGSELTLRYIGAGDVDAIERWLEHRRPADLAEPEETHMAEPLERVTLGELVIAGATANRIGALAVVVGSAFQVFEQAFDDPLEPIGRLLPFLDDVLDASGAIAIALIVAAVAVVIGWLASIATTVTRYWEFTAELSDDELRSSYGLFSRFRVTSPVHRIQTIRIEEPLLRRLFGYASVIAETAGSPGTSSGGPGVVTPIAPVDEAISMSSGLLAHDGEIYRRLGPVSPLTLRRGLVRGLVVAAGISTGVGLGGGPWHVVLPVAIGVAWWYARARYRALGYRIDGGQVVTRSGVFSRLTWSVPIAKVQTVAVRSSPFQRRLGLASVSIDTAGGSTRIPIVDLPTEVAARVATTLTRQAVAAADADAV